MKISTDEIKLRTIAERNSVTRSILGFFISSAAVKFLKQEEFEKLKRAFLHPEPGEIVHNFYFSIPEESQNYKIDIATLTLFWTAKEDRIKDKIGNLWTIYRLNISFSAKERYGIYGKLLDNWLECIESIAKFVSEIKKNYSKEISIMTHSSSERIELEKKEKEQKISKTLFEIFSRNDCRNIRKNMRVGSTKRISKNSLFDKVPNGTYEFFVGEGKSYYFLQKKYEITIADESCTLTRKK